MVERSITVASLNLYRRRRLAPVKQVGSTCGNSKVRLPAASVKSGRPSTRTPAARITRLILMTRRLNYSILDVFAEHPLEGNPLAVIHDGRGLSDAAMQAIARETNLSETTFVLPSENPEQDRAEGVRVRIFTTQEELPFAGHPTLGTASWVHLHHPPLQGATDFKLRLNVGPIRVRLQPRPAPESGVLATMWQNDPVFGQIHDRSQVARVLGLRPSDLLEDAMPQTVSTGNPFCVVAVQLEALKRLAIPQKEASEWLKEKKTRWFYCIAPESEGRPDCGTAEVTAWRARMLFYSGEDPATGSAAGCAIAWMVRHGWANSGRDVVLHQGIEMGRPSRLVVQATCQDNGVRSITVSGRTIPVAEGAFFLPL